MKFTRWHLLALPLMALALSVLSSGGAGVVQAASGGPVLILGIDGDDSDSGDPTPGHGALSIYAGMFDSVMGNVANGGSGILAVGADDPSVNPGSTAGAWIRDVALLMTGTPAVTYVNDAAIAGQSFAGFAIIYVPSSTPETTGGINQAESDALSARGADVAAFINSGGGHISLTQTDNTNPYGWLAPLGGITPLQAPGGVLPDDGEFDDVTATAAGLAMGITNTNLDLCCWHEVFTSFPSFLNVLARANEPASATFNEHAAALGGNQVVVVRNGVDLTVSKELKPGQPRAAVGGRLYYLIRVKNQGTVASPAPPNTVRIIDTPPAGTTVAAWSIISGSGSCSLDGAGRLGCDLGGRMAPGAETVVEVVIRTPTAGTLTNTVEVDPFKRITETNEGNNIATKTTTVP